jgi:cysteine desulfurase
MSEEAIHLDCNATTPVLPEGVEGMLPYLREQFGNPSSSHSTTCASPKPADRSRRRTPSASCKGETDSGNVRIASAS